MQKVTSNEVTVSMLTPSFVRHLRAENRSERTVAAYLLGTGGLARFLTETGMPQDVASIRREHIESYIADCLSRNAPATANQRYRSLQAFWKWATEEGEVAENPMRRMRPPAVPEKAVPVLSDEQIRLLLAGCDSKTFEGRRDEALIRLFIDSGVRLAEMVGMQTDDIDLDGHVVRVTGKGRRPRLVGFGDRTARAIDRYIRRRGPYPGPLWTGATSQA